MKSNEKRKRIPYVRPPGIENTLDGGMTPEQREVINKKADKIISGHKKAKELEDLVKQNSYEDDRTEPNFIDLSISEEDNIMKSLGAGGMD